MLQEIIRVKRLRLREKKITVPLADLKAEAKDAPDTRDFKGCISGEKISLIAEIKKASPTKGMIREDFKPTEIARIYEDNGAAAISVLTEEDYFKGKDSYLKDIRKITNIPLLRKDFIFDEYQIYESKVLGADAILLISSILDKPQLIEYIELSKELDIDPLVEVHNWRELDKALQSEADIIGINNRNLATFDTDINVTIELIKDIPEGKIVVSESGINTREDVERLEEAGVKAVLVGEALMRSKDIGGKIKELVGRW